MKYSSFKSNYIKNQNKSIAKNKTKKSINFKYYNIKKSTKTNEKIRNVIINKYFFHEFKQHIVYDTCIILDIDTTIPEIIL